eukprot:3449797-Ditylum_brightwellii.AAC.1
MFSSNICLFGGQLAGVRVRAPAGGDLVGSPGFKLGAPDQHEAIREAINVAIFKWSMLLRVKVSFGGKIFSFSYLGLGSVVGNTLGHILGVFDGVTAGDFVGQQRICQLMIVHWTIGNTSQGKCTRRAQ